MSLRVLPTVTVGDKNYVALHFPDLAHEQSAEVGGEPFRRDWTILIYYEERTCRCYIFWRGENFPTELILNALGKVVGVMPWAPWRRRLSGATGCCTLCSGTVAKVVAAIEDLCGPAADDFVWQTTWPELVALR